MACFRSRRPQKTFLWPILLKKKDTIPNFGQKALANPFGKKQNFRLFYSLKWLVSYLEGHKTLSFLPTSLKKKKGQNCQF